MPNLSGRGMDHCLLFAYRNVKAPIGKQWAASDREEELHNKAPQRNIELVKLTFPCYPGSET